MILQALTRYYETLRELDQIAPRYYTKANVSYGLQLDFDGSLIGILRLKTTIERGKKSVEVPQILQVPDQKIKAGTKPPANFLCDNAAFMMGLDTKDKPDQALMYFQTAKETHLMILSGVKNDAAKAICLYFENWSPHEALENIHIVPILKDLSRGGQFVFILPDGNYAHNDPEILSAWEQYNIRNQSSIRMQCLITGERDAPISLLHPKIWDLDPSQSFGGSLVSFNDPAYESYGHELRDGTGQGQNAPVSEYAAFAYTTALNHMVSTDDCHLKLGDDMLVFWAETAEPKYQSIFCEWLNPRMETAHVLYQTLKKIAIGSAIDIDGLQLSTPFYILCLSPSTSRISVRYFLRNTFGSLADNLGEHYRNLEIIMNKDEPLFLRLEDLVAEISSKAQPNVVKKFSSEILRSIIYGVPYPRKLFLTALSHVLRNPNENTRTRVSIIKACLSRYAKLNQCEEVPTVSLNEQSTNVAYTLGRLFALLEKAQLNAIDNIKTTITDKFFDAACTTPRLAFASLLKLNRHHLAKDDRFGVYLEKRICSVMDKLNVDCDPYPVRHTPEQQGLFILGYYHQKQDIYTNKSLQEAE